MAGPGAGAGPYEKDVGHEQMHCSQTLIRSGADIDNGYKWASCH